MCMKPNDTETKEKETTENTELPVSDDALDNVSGGLGGGIDGSHWIRMPAQKSHTYPHEMVEIHVR